MGQDRTTSTGKLIFDRRLPISAFREEPRFLRLTHLLAFSGEHEIAVAYLSHERTGLATREEPAYSLNLVMLGTAGEQTAKAAFATQTSANRGLYVGKSGKFLVFANGRLELLSTALKSEKRVILSEGAKPAITILPSVDRQTILTLNTAPTGTLVDLWDANSLEKISSCTMQGSWPDSLINDVDAGLVSDASSPETHQVAIGRVCGKHRVIYKWTGDPEFPAMISENAILLGGAYSHFQIIREGEGIIKEEHFGKRDLVDSEIRQSADGAFFAVAIKTFRGGSSFFDVSPHLSGLRIVVFSSQGLSKVADIRVPHIPKNRFDFSLSPQGSRIAILTDDYLQVFSL